MRKPVTAITGIGLGVLIVLFLRSEANPIGLIGNRWQFLNRQIDWLSGLTLLNPESVNDLVVQGMCDLEPHNRGNRHTIEESMRQVPALWTPVYEEWQENMPNNQWFVQTANERCGYQNSVTMTCTPEGCIMLQEPNTFGSNRGLENE